MCTGLPCCPNTFGIDEYTTGIVRMARRELNRVGASHANFSHGLVFPGFGINVHHGETGYHRETGCFKMVSDQAVRGHEGTRNEGSDFG